MRRHLMINGTPLCQCPVVPETDGMTCGQEDRDSAEKAVEIIRERYAVSGRVLPLIAVELGACPTTSEDYGRTYSFAESLTTEEIFKCIFDDLQLLENQEWEPDSDSISATRELLTELQRRVG